MSSEDWIGWEVTYHSVKKAILKKEDVLIAFLHWTLIKSGCLCVGLGEVEDKNDKGSELLPEGWNKNNSYSIRYISIKGDKPFLLKASIVKEFLVQELVRIEDMTITTLTLNANTVPVTDFDKSLAELIPEHKSIWNKFKTELIGKLLKSESKDEETQTHTQYHSDILPFVDRIEAVDPGRIDRDRDRERYADPLGVGRSDLDPLGRNRGRGGMLFDPFNPLRNERLPSNINSGVPGRLPRGAVPPGARFDPFGPPDLGFPGQRPRPRFPFEDDDSGPDYYM